MSEEIKEIIEDLPQEEKSEIDLLKEALDENKNRLLRTLADFDNFKKRVQLDKAQFIQFANETLITELLPVLDGFSRAMESASNSKAEEDIRKGLALIKKQFEDTLIKHGVKEIASLGLPYDPNIHEAIMQKEDKGPAGVILEEMQKGYALNGRVIRPSMVIVSKKSEIRSPKP
ncbi:MAG: nucleotide exchange factor GrpE [Candidatus Margulisiibacteriota bacterium]